MSTVQVFTSEKFPAVKSVMLYDCIMPRLHINPQTFPSFFCIWGFPKQHLKGEKMCLFCTPNKSVGEISPIQLSECGSREMWGNNNQVPFGFHGYNLIKNRDSVCHGVGGRATLPPPIPLCPTLTTVHSQRTSWRDQTEGSLESRAFFEKTSEALRALSACRLLLHRIIFN